MKIIIKKRETATLFLSKSGIRLQEEGIVVTEKRTDLALEARESFPRNNVEIQGVVLEKKKCLGGQVKVTTVIIRDDAGSRAMKKPKGTYITIESHLMLDGDGEERDSLLLCISEQLEKMIHGMKQKSVLIVGLGNREVTPDALGPMVSNNIIVTKHLFDMDVDVDKNFSCVSKSISLKILVLIKLFSGAHIIFFISYHSIQNGINNKRHKTFFIILVFYSKCHKPKYQKYRY